MRWQLAILPFWVLYWQVQCHLFVGDPPPFRAHGDISYLIMPLNGDPNIPIGQQPFPCKGHHSDLDGPGGIPVAEWKAGQNVTFSTNTTGPTMNKGGAAHSGGSCQVAFSYDKGKSWVVVQNWEGNCPRVATPGEVTNVYDPNQNYSFTIPGDFPTGQRVIFAWVWINATGNREFYMSCSSVDIKGSGNATNVTPKGPPLLIANLDPIRNECYTNEGTSLIYPSKFNGMTKTERAPLALKLQDFPAKDPCGCGSDNSTILDVLKNPTKGQNTTNSMNTIAPAATLASQSCGCHGVTTY